MPNRAFIQMYDIKCAIWSETAFFFAYAQAILTITHRHMNEIQ